MDNDIRNRVPSRVRGSYFGLVHARLRNTDFHEDRRILGGRVGRTRFVCNNYQYVVGEIIDRVIIRKSNYDQLPMDPKYLERVKKNKQHPDPYYEQSSKNRITPTTPDFSEEETVDGDEYHNYERMFQER